MIATHASDVKLPGCDGAYRLRSEVLDALMEAKGIRSVAAQARALGVHRATMFRIRAGKTQVNLDLALALAHLAGTSVEALFGRTHPPTSPASPSPPPAPKGGQP